MWHVFPYILLLNKLVYGEVITLINEENVTCVLTEESVQSGLYITSPVEPIQVHRSPQEIPNWVYDDWSKTSTQHQTFYPITDIRWEGLKLLDKPNINLDPKPISLSICFNRRLSLQAVGSNYRRELVHLQHESENGSCRWSQYIIDQYRILQVEVTNGSYSTSEAWKFTFPVNYLTLPKVGVFVKIHQYYFKFAQSVGEQPSLVELPKINSSLSIFVSVDVGCYLDVVLQSGNRNETARVEGFNKNEFKIWKQVNIEIYNSDKLFFFRGRHDGGKVGYWALDKIYVGRPSIDVYDKNLKSSSNHWCKSLIPSVEKPVFCNRTGYLGENCSISCAQILGKSFEFCQEFKACSENGKCNCAWGYTGKNCKEKCRENYWGLNCTSQVNNSQCERYNNIVGCTKCTGKFFGDQCLKQLPVVLYPPVLKSIQEEFIEVSLENLKFEGVKPEFYQIQYRVKNESFFKNLSLVPFLESFKNVVKITNLSTKELEYVVRVLLIVEGQFYEKDIPELATYKKSLEVFYISDDLVQLSWSPSFKNNYVVKYQCTRKKSGEKAYTELKPSNNSANIEDFDRFSNCVVQLDIGGELRDEISVPTPSFTTEVIEKILPKSVTLLEDEIVVNFDEFKYHRIMIEFLLNCTCLSDWCQNVSNSFSFKFERSQKITRTKLKLLPFTDYKVEVKTKLDENVSRIFKTRTSLTKPRSLQNFTMYSSNGSFVRLKWRDNYPPTGFPEFYNITYLDEYLQTKVEPCEIWKDFKCAGVDVKNENPYYLSIKVKNFNVSEWSSPSRTLVATKGKITGAPQNLSLTLSQKSHEIILKWKHPEYTLDKLEKFCVKVDGNGEVKDYEMFLERYAENYWIKIPVEHRKDYKITVWGKNREEGEKAAINVTILSAFVEHSLSPVVEWCSNQCHLLIPRINHAKLDAIAINRKIKKKEMKRAYKSLKNETGTVDGWLVKLETVDENNLEAEIGEAAFKAVSVKNSNYRMRFVVVLDEENSDPIATYAEESREETKSASIEKYTTHTLITLLCLSLMLTISGYIYFRRKYDQAEYNRGKHVEMVRLISPGENNFIKREDLESSLQESLLDYDLVNQFQVIDFEETKICNIHFKSREDNGPKDYSNASHIRIQLLSEDKQSDIFHYIASKEPTTSKANDFWRMIWQENVATIVMIGSSTESEKDTEKYWDIEGSRKYGEITVKLTNAQIYPELTYRIFYVSHEKLFRRKLVHIQLNRNIDLKDYYYPDEILMILKQFGKRPTNKNTIGRRRTTKESSPVLLHADSGMEIIGLIVLCDLALNAIEMYDQVNICILLKHLRKQHLIPDLLAQKYFILAHLVLKESYVKIENIGIKNQLKLLEMWHHHDKEVQSWANSTLENTSFSTTLVNSKMIKKFVFCNNPSEQNRTNFWKTVISNKIKHILFLNKCKQPISCDFVGDGDTTVKIQEKTTIYTNDVIEEKPFTKRIVSFKFNNRTTNPEFPEKSENVYLFELIEEWDFKNTTENIEKTVSLIEDVRGDGSILIVCSENSQSNVLFALLFYAIDELDHSVVIDISRPLRILRRSKLQFVPNWETLSFIYHVVGEYKKKQEEEVVILG